MSELLTFPSSASGLDFTSGHPGAVVMRIRLSIPIQHQLGILRIPSQQANIPLHKEMRVPSGHSHVSGKQLPDVALALTHLELEKHEHN